MLNIRVVGRRISRFFGGHAAPSDITFFEVKSLYNEAYEQKARARNALRRYRKMTLEAQAMDEAYRAQLGLTDRRAA